MQRVSSARVRVDAGVVGEIDCGLCILLGIAEGDDEATATRLAGKIARLRIFENEEGKFDRSVLDVGAEALVVSQFTLIRTPRRATGRASPMPPGPSGPSRSTKASVRPSKRRACVWPGACSGRGWRSSS